MAAVTGVANGARGLAAKVGASFSGLSGPKTKPRPKGQVPVRRPSSGGGPRFTASPQAGQARPPQSDQPRPGSAQAGSPQAGSPQAGLTQAGSTQTRSALLNLQRIEPISVMKFSFLLSLVAWVALFVAVAILYFTLSKLGVFAQIEKTIGLVTFNKNHPGSNAASWFSASRVLEYTAIVCTINTVLFTALATVGAAVYNVITGLTGGIEVTLRESD
jgi:hypothetical protein